MKDFKYNILDLMKKLPHRYPFLLIDKILDIEISDERKRIVGMKNVTINEPFFQGHFANYPVMPGVLILEALAQVAGVLSIELIGERKEDELYYFVGVDNTRFKRPVLPGDQLKLDLTLLSSKRGVAKYKGIASVDGQLAAGGEIMIAVKKVL